jgi:hypothetical protein
MADELINDWKAGSENYRAKNDKLYKQLKQTKGKQLDKSFHQLHEEAFKKIDCLDCANCCKTTSPIFYKADIDRLSTVVKMKSADFISTYLKIDQEGDYVLQSSPCAFLGPDNKCTVYESRPTACREFPNTNRKGMQQIINLTFNNAEICPAVYNMLERFKEVKV